MVVGLLTRKRTNGGVRYRPLGSELRTSEVALTGFLNANSAASDVCLIAVVI